MSEVSRDEIAGWIVDALKKLGGSAHYVLVAKEIWRTHKSEMPETGTSFYTWQYEMRWASQALRNRGLLKKANVSGSPKGVWTLTKEAY